MMQVDQCKYRIYQTYNKAVFAVINVLLYFIEY